MIQDLDSGFRVGGPGLAVLLVIYGSGFRVQGSGFRVQGSGFKVPNSNFWVLGSGFRVQGSGFRVQGSGFRFQGSEIRAQGLPHDAVPFSRKWKSLFHKCSTIIYLIQLCINFRCHAL